MKSSQPELPGRGRPSRLSALPFTIMCAPRKLALLVVAAVLVGAAGCGYHLIGSSSNLPAKLQRLYVAPFINRSGRAELDQRLTEQITQEWVRRGRFQLVSGAEQADVVLSGTVLNAGVSPVQFDKSGRATAYQLTVVADVQFVDRTGEKPVVLWHDPHFSRNVSYQVSLSAVDYFDQEVQAIETVARDFARGLVVTILEGF